MLGGSIGSEVLQYVNQWVPKKSYTKEHGFQTDLQEFLDSRLNESSAGMGLLEAGNNRRSLPVKREHGSVNADVAIADEVGIELKRDFTNSQKHRLSGQITDYKKEFPFIIVVACGISDIDGWRELQNEYENNTMAIGMNQSEVHFVHKQKQHFGKDPSQVNRDRDGFIGGGGGLL